MNTFINTGLSTAIFVQPTIEELLLVFNSSLAPNQEHVNLCETEQFWNYEVYNFKELADQQDSLLNSLLQGWGVTKPGLYYYYQHDSANTFGVNTFEESPRTSQEYQQVWTIAY